MWSTSGSTWASADATVDAIIVDRDPELLVREMVHSNFLPAGHGLDPELVYEYTNKGNLVAVVSNGTAVLGLGDIGAMAGKPVMEGKGVLFKRFAAVDVFDIELDTKDADEIIRTCEVLAPTFGGINLEDIKAPECFHIEDELKKRLDIPVFHDDQHGTAVVVLAALISALRAAGREAADLHVVLNWFTELERLVPTR